ncbi:efflux RND transporter periplasmic adaptor subunit [Gimesia algae]|uniref:Efflux pump periplasmic linker BepF n=1 Tax=Gimesia algae TaxID=2527971 RepID=A0A517VFN7_9PLAN|nr:efflux RND transporter periplasmic adaptor subunit [Gimesia algae]QDT91821.1 Efflux pump periplasmic linker BepF [Gimesia algae]
MNFSRALSESFFFGNKLTFRQKIASYGKRFVWSVAALLLAVFVGLFWVKPHRVFSTEVTVNEKTQAGIPVDVIELKPVHSFSRKRTYTGKVTAARVSELAFERSGKLFEIVVDEGDQVQEGMVLAQLNTRHLQVMRLKLQAERAAAQAKLDELEAGPRVQTVAVAEAEVRRLNARLKNLQADHDRNQKLLKRNAITSSDYEASQYDVEQQQAQLDAARSRLSELQEGTRKEEIAAQKAVVANLDASLEDNRVDLDDTVLKAPFSGHISKRYADEGTVIFPNVPLFRLVEDQRLEAHIGVPVDMAVNLKRGSQQEVGLNGKNYQSTLKAILPELDPVTRTQEVVLSLSEKAAKQLVPGQVIRIEISEPVEMQGFWLPLSSLARGERGLWSAYAVIAGKEVGENVLEKRQVEVLHTEDNRVLVRGTLKTGDQIVVDGIHKLTGHQRVVIQDRR